MNRWDLIDHLVEVALAEDPDTTADRLLRTLAAFTGGRRAALFEIGLDRLRLAHSRGVDEAALAEAEEAWRDRRAELMAGQAVLGARSVVHPVFEGRQFAGLLFADRTDAMPFADERDLQAVGKFARLAARALTARRAEPAGYLARTPPADVARDQLLVVLEQNEWNIARVARLLGVTRPTVYARLRRFGLPRRRWRVGKQRA